MSTELLREVERVVETPRAGNEIEWLIDNAIAYEAVLEAICGARRTVCISQLAFDADCVAHSDDGESVNVLGMLIGAAARHDLDVRILLNASILVNTVKPLRAELARRGARGIEVRGIGRFPQLLHAKLLIVDDRDAFLLGSPFVNGYWDDSSHGPEDARRPSRELGGRPLHDLSLRVRGDAVVALRSIFDEWWTEVADEREYGTSECRAESGCGAVEVASTVPANVLPRRPEGHTDILHAMLDGIRGARELLYIEHQYLSSRPVIGAIVEALARSPGLEVIALVNQNPDVTAYRGWQNARLDESGLAKHPRFGLFALWTRARLGDVTVLNQVFVHSKVIIADEWATVGSANVDGVSLHSYGDDFESRLGERVFRGVRNFDVNLVLRGDDDDDVSAAIAELRDALWSEHLGGASGAGDRPACGWLRRWRDCASENIARLNSPRNDARDAEARSFVLPYSRAPHPAEQLAAVGVRARKDLLLRFDPGWLEVHCSPNWIRNMFA